eukprot:GFUD01009496.1.p1 GENE.GFUD01009496.1~~GFUD01009496.1.p1  ORF type:complete len:171 (-),score=30.23 GFUD01009496.1:134-646(-)
MTVLFSTSGLFKTFETFAVFICLVIHRIGNQGSQVWFGTADFEMNYKNTPSEVDAEVLGVGILTCMSIVSLSILASYLIEGREVVQSTVIDAAFCIIAATLLLTSGGMTCFTYNSVFALSGPPTVANMSISRNSQQVAGAMGVMCIVTGLLYLADFFYLLCQRNALLQQY